MKLPVRESYREIPLYAPTRKTYRVDLSDNTNLFGMPPAAERLLRESPASLVTRYPVSYAPDLKHALATHLWVDEARLTTGCGSDDVIDGALRALLEPGERMAFPEPTFVMMGYFARVNGLRPVAVPLKEDWDIDVDGLLATGARLIYVCTPNNPTGTVVSRAALERLVEHAPGVVLVDEAYTDFAREGFLDLALKRKNVLVTRTFSKAFGLASMRVGYGVGDPALVAELEKARGPYKVSALAERMAVVALQEDIEWVEEKAQEAVEIRGRLVEELGKLGLKALPSEANFVMVPVPGALEVQERMRAREVNVRAFRDLKGVGDALRIGCAPWPLMQEALDAFREALR